MKDLAVKHCLGIALFGYIYILYQLLHKGFVGKKLIDTISKVAFFEYFLQRIGSQNLCFFGKNAATIFFGNGTEIGRSLGISTNGGIPNSWMVYFLENPSIKRILFIRKPPFGYAEIIGPQQIETNWDHHWIHVFSTSHMIGVDAGQGSLGQERWERLTSERQTGLLEVKICP